MAQKKSSFVVVLGFDSNFEIIIPVPEGIDTTANNNHLKKDDKYIVTASMPEHWEGHTNMMKVNIVS